MRFGMDGTQVLQRASRIKPAKLRTAILVVATTSPASKNSKFIYLIKHGSPLNIARGAAALSFILSGFLQMRAACQKKLPADRAFGPFAAHGGLRRPLRSAHASALALRGRLRAKSRAFSAIVRKGGTAPTRACGCGPPPLFGGIRRVAHYCQDAGFCHAIFSPDASFTFYLFQQSVPQMISIGFLSPSKISEHNKIRFFNWQSAAFYFIVLQHFTSLCLTGDHQNTAIVPLVVAGVNVKSCSSHCAPAPPHKAIPVPAFPA